MKRAWFRPRAAADVHDAYRWYEKQRPGLGEQFLAELAATLESVTASPHSYPAVHRSTRRALLVRFPYAVFFLERSHGILVVAVYHAKRDPRGWTRRG